MKVELGVVLLKAALATRQLPLLAVTQLLAPPGLNVPVMVALATV